LRVYDKHGPTRIELECKEDWAAAAWSMLVDADSQQLEGLIRDFLDFSRWSAWVQALHGVARVAVRACKSVEEGACEALNRKCNWLWKQVARTLAIVDVYSECTGRMELLDELVKYGTYRMSREDAELVQTALDSEVMAF
jgi:hypothetical protein